eukprot:2143891-Rhodomonas_salina.1
MQASVSGGKRSRPVDSSTVVTNVDDGPSFGVLKPGDRRERFTAAPPPLGTRSSTKQWWECESSDISAVTDWELG